MRRNIMVDYGPRENPDKVKRNATVYGNWAVVRSVNKERARSATGPWVFSITDITSGRAARRGLSNAEAHRIAHLLAIHPLLCRSDINAIMMDKSRDGKALRAKVLRDWRAFVKLHHVPNDHSR